MQIFKLFLAFTPQKSPILLLYFHLNFSLGGTRIWKLLEERIIADGKVIGDDILKVDMFLNHQIDVHLLQEIGKEFKRRFDGCNINKILTIEASGIGIACITAQYFSVPVVFAKKGRRTKMWAAMSTPPLSTPSQRARTALLQCRKTT